MTEFAKYVSENEIIRPKKHLRTPQIVAFNFDKNESLLRQEGYLPLQYDDAQCQEGYYNKPQYELTDEAILVHWVEEEVQEEGAE